MVADDGSGTQRWWELVTVVASYNSKCKWCSNVKGCGLVSLEHRKLKVKEKFKGMWFGFFRT